ncbi:MAG: serine/threonine protein phosphatase [Deltaproteobacteria bacterium]|nr:serine/threonine protein phosphatase [Deltaproteobacteria bacterium]
MPEGAVVYAVGDVHGRIDLLEELLAGVVADAAWHPARRRVLVMLGDYVSRGLDSRGVVELLRRWEAPGFERVALRGNHEDLLLRYLDGDHAAGRHWFDYDGLEALAHYGVRPAPGRGSLEALRQGLRQALPEEHLAFFRSLPVSHGEGGYHFVHAGVCPGVPLPAQSRHDQMWIRRPFLESERDHGAVVVHGHSVTREPEVRPNRIGIDTGAYRTGVLTCLALEGSRRWFLQTVPRGARG